jgi:hypothetical protein
VPPPLVGRAGDYRRALYAETDRSSSRHTGSTPKSSRRWLITASASCGAARAPSRKTPRRLSGSRSPASTRLSPCGAGSVRCILRWSADRADCLGRPQPGGPSRARLPCGCLDPGHVRERTAGGLDFADSTLTRLSGYFRGAGIGPVFSHLPRRSCLASGPLQKSGSAQLGFRCWSRVIVADRLRAQSAMWPTTWGISNRLPVSPVCRNATLLSTGIRPLRAWSSNPASPLPV